ncbi:hydroxyacid dehydrogenase [Cerasicoccus maritimus]|uniref:hydroxyacid dehydrogenase n=1 Tax=Cerasicoccus maritimus TaxID=490089 RepID=UPI002852CBD3|nr:hydroxyacid dehydrogenase [Cerasicoccus maritimus]
MYSASNSQPAANPNKRPSIPSNSRVLFSLTQNEKTLFFPNMEISSSINAEWEWMSGENLSQEQWAGALGEIKPDVIVSCWSTPRLPESINGELPVKYVSHLSGTVRHFLPRTFLERGGRVTNWGGIVGPTVSEHALLLALASLRNIEGWKSVINTHSTTAMHPTFRVETASLYRRTVGIHGFGHVARKLIQLLKPFDVTIKCYSSGVPRGVIEEAGVIPCESLDAIFTGSDVLFECEALTVATRMSVTAELLALLPDGALFVNVGRGELIDEDALFAEASNERLRLALDVVHGEMLPDSRFIGMPGVLLSPHIAGPTLDHFAQCGENALDNVQRYLRGATLHAEVTLAIYDRMT